MLPENDELSPLDDRLAEIKFDSPDESDAVLTAIFGNDGAVRTGTATLAPGAPPTSLLFGF